MVYCAMAGEELRPRRPHEEEHGRIGILEYRAAAISSAPSC
jgi:hypothetical protein